MTVPVFQWQLHLGETKNGRQVWPKEEQHECHEQILLQMYFDFVVGFNNTNSFGWRVRKRGRIGYIM